MANQKISQLTPLTSIDPLDLIPVVDTSAGETKHATFANFTSSVVLAGDVQGTPGSNTYRTESIKDEHVSQSAGISWTKLSYVGSLIPTGSNYLGTASRAISASISAYASTYDLNYIGDNFGQFTYRNKIINGNFNVWQRGSSFDCVSASSRLFGNYDVSDNTSRSFSIATADRWIWRQDNETGSARVVISKETSDIPTAYDNNIPIRPKNVLKLEVQEGDPLINLMSPTGSYYVLQQNIEGIYSQLLVNAPMVLSFWTKTIYPFSVYVRTLGSPGYIHTADFWDASNTWKKYELPIAKIPQLAAAGLYYDERFDLSVGFVLGAGYSFTYDGSPLSTLGSGSWSSNTLSNIVNNYNYSNYYSIMVPPQGGQPSDCNGRTFLLSQVQLESGLAATQYEVMPPKEELENCQRYFAGTSPIANAGVTPKLYIEGRGGLSIYSHTGSNYDTDISTWPTARWEFPITQRTYPTIRAGNPLSSIITNSCWVSAQDARSASVAGHTIFADVNKHLYIVDPTANPNGTFSLLYGRDVSAEPLDNPPTLHSVDSVVVGIYDIFEERNMNKTYYVDLYIDSEQYY